MKMTTEKLKEPFKLPYDGFSSPIEWTEGIGFSFFGGCKDNLASLYKIGISKSELQKDAPIKALWISVTYGEKTPEGVTLAPREGSLWDPINLESRDEYFYNVATDKFYYQDREINPKDIISDIQTKHLRPSKLVVGFALRVRLFLWRTGLPWAVNAIDKVLILLLWLISGERLEPSIWERILSKTRAEFSRTPINEGGVKFKDSETMDFFGYRAKRWSVVFYCALHVTVYLIFFYKQIKYEVLVKMLGNNFLVLCYVVVSFAITESWIPKILKWAIISITPGIFNQVASKKFKI